jgi:Protein of unknown function (DUF2934)
MATTKTNKLGPSCTMEQLTQKIRNKAQELYEKSGRKQGRDIANWLEAERIVKSQGCRI